LKESADRRAGAPPMIWIVVVELRSPVRAMVVPRILAVRIRYPPLMMTDASPMFVYGVSSPEPRGRSRVQKLYAELRSSREVNDHFTKWINNTVPKKYMTSEPSLNARSSRDVFQLRIVTPFLTAALMPEPRIVVGRLVPDDNETAISCCSPKPPYTIRTVLSSYVCLEDLVSNVTSKNY
jgi:hypothetical protein